MTVWRGPSGRWKASVTLHVGVFDSEAEALKAVELTWASEDLIALKAWLRKEYGNNHGGYRYGKRRL